MKRILVVLLVTLTGCFLASNIPKEQRALLARQNVTLEVSNTGVQPYKVYVLMSGVKFLLGSVFPSEVRCFELTAANTQQYITIKDLNGETIGPDFMPQDAPSRAWKMRIGNSPLHDVLSLMPAMERCKRK